MVFLLVCGGGATVRPAQVGLLGILVHSCSEDKTEPRAPPTRKWRLSMGPPGDREACQVAGRLASGRGTPVVSQAPPSEGPALGFLSPPTGFGSLGSGQGPMSSFCAGPADLQLSLQCSLTVGSQGPGLPDQGCDPRRQAKPPSSISQSLSAPS